MTKCALLAVLVTLSLATPATAAEPPKAGKFWAQGMEAMADIGFRLPLEGEASMHMLGCTVTATKASCRLAIHTKPVDCRVRVDLTKRGATYPLRSWGCPSEWRPELYHHPTLDELRQLRVLRLPTPAPGGLYEAI